MALHLNVQFANWTFGNVQLCTLPWPTLWYVNIVSMKLLIKKWSAKKIQNREIIFWIWIVRKASRKRCHEQRPWLIVLALVQEDVCECLLWHLPRDISFNSQKTSFYKAQTPVWSDLLKGTQLGCDGTPVTTMPPTSGPASKSLGTWGCLGFANHLSSSCLPKDDLICYYLTEFQLHSETT